MSETLISNTGLLIIARARDAVRAALVVMSEEVGLDLEDDSGCLTIRAAAAELGGMASEWGTMAQDAWVEAALREENAAWNAVADAHAPLGPAVHRPAQESDRGA